VREESIAVESRARPRIAVRGAVGRVVLLCLALVGCERCSAKPEPIARAAVAAPLAAAAAPCPNEMALVAFAGGKVCVDRYEAAIEEWPYSHALEGEDAGARRAVPAQEIKPQVNVSQTQAAAACAASAKRLCTAQEWGAACRGPQNQVYPYGNEYAAGACNEGRPSPVKAVLGASGAGGKLDDPRLAEADNGLAPGGSFPKCVTALGIFDMHGNAHEWVSDSSKPGYGTFVGGFFADGTGNGAGCTYKTTAHGKEYHDYSTGFRCCKDAE
jgi:formylglycine-generating enzyme